ncbi:GtrA family protein [Caballeronia sp. LjRoot31]|uniref:GtrA family protein n=1 Tax=Caballeronia sp. LjRoot31 TaxID=3342324 RepID=UPI003ECF1A95
MNRALVKKLLAFGCVGAVGFAVDAGVLSLLAQKLGVNVYLARVISFLIAVFVTWLLNRTWVFKAAEGKTGDKRLEYISYFAVQSVGALLNLGVFAALVASHAALRAYPVVPLAAGSIVGMFFNYTGAHFWVFKRR